MFLHGQKYLEIWFCCTVLTFIKWFQGVFKIFRYIYCGLYGATRGTWGKKQNILVSTRKYLVSTRNVLMCTIRVIASHAHIMHSSGGFVIHLPICPEVRCVWAVCHSIFLLMPFRVKMSDENLSYWHCEFKGLKWFLYVIENVFWMLFSVLICVCAPLLSFIPSFFTYVSNSSYSSHHNAVHPAAKQESK